MLQKQSNQFIDYQISLDYFDEGGSVQFYPIKNHKNLGFKEFRSKHHAIIAYKNQKRLAKFDLAPKVLSLLISLPFATLPDIISGWGFITEIAKIPEENSFPLKKIQNLVDEIYKKTKLKFWDCHWYNLGLIVRGRSKKIVCIDTGQESFDHLSNAWGNVNPGPKCGYCYKYKCKCF